MFYSSPAAPERGFLGERGGGRGRTGNTQDTLCIGNFLVRMSWKTTVALLRDTRSCLRFWTCLQTLRLMAVHKEKYEIKLLRMKKHQNPSSPTTWNRVGSQSGVIGYAEPSASLPGQSLTLLICSGWGLRWFCCCEGLQGPIRPWLFAAATLGLPPCFLSRLKSPPIALSTSLCQLLNTASKRFLHTLFTLISSSKPASPKLMGRGELLHLTQRDRCGLIPPSRIGHNKGTSVPDPAVVPEP